GGSAPVAAVEVRTRRRTLAGRTMLLSTHILSEASALCSRIVILSRGRLVAVDTPEGLAQRLAGVARLVVRVDGPADAVATQLATLPGVVGVERGAPDGLAGTAFALSARDPGPVPRALGAAVLGGGR